jgi:LacI family transcriptional regulator
VGRLEGYRRTLVRENLTAPPGYIVAGRSGNDEGGVSGYEAMRKLLSLTPRPDGVFCYNDPIAMGALKAILESGLRVPDDVAVIGCGNVYHSQLLRVPLSSVDQDSAKIGERAAKLALALIEAKGSTVRPRTILLKPSVVARESTARSRATQSQPVSG